MASESYVPIIEITDENFKTMWPAISRAISESSFVALDCELSGLGSKSKLNSPMIDVRYTNIKEITKEYSIVSLGISCFKCLFCSQLNTSFDDGNDGLVKSHSYLVQTFNIFTLCSQKYTVEMKGLKFLLSHGFDFNKQYAHGLQYERGEDKEIGENSPLSVKKLFHCIIQHQKPIVLHNGFLDLMFLYQSFYTELPRNIESFAADLFEMFPSGIYDTKYISEFHQSFSATYLEFLFKYLQIENDNRTNSGDWHCRLKFLPYPQNMAHLKWFYYMQIFDENIDKNEMSKPLCESYKYHGWCSEAENCSSSHNINRIVLELKELSNKKRRKFSNGVANVSLAQLINMEKHKLEEDKKVSSSLLSKDGTFSNKRGGDVNGSSSQKYSDLIKRKNNSVEIENNDVGCRIHTSNLEFKTANVNTKCLCKKNDIENSSSLDSGARDVISENFNGERNSSCSGHSAGFDAFMTGFIFACDITTLGQLPNASAFHNSKELKLNHIAGKVYLIGKEFPFLVRNSSYNGTSANHDRVIKLLRNA
ncbi:UNVERIFIED_CONTAM: hypothetical protein RMT77_007951 [Armadillidium vulgare]